MASKKNDHFDHWANADIGFELASKLLSDPSKHILLGSRSIEKGEIALKDLQSREQLGTVELLHLDVANEESIMAATKTAESKNGRLDILINNAVLGWPTGTQGE